MNKKAECIRTVANWSMHDKAYTYDNRAFDKKKMLEAMPVSSPKMEALFKKIQELDAQDMREHGKLFKHMVFTDIKSSAYGAKLLAAGFAAKGFVPAYDRDLKLDERRLLRTKGNNFALLCSTVLYGKPIGARFRKSILELFNRRPDNVYGEHVRFIILDQGFKEGIDIYDIKYVHLFEPLVTAADEKQAIGRGTRLCGQKGLDFDPTRGWPLHVIRYEVEIPGQELQDKYGSTRMFDMFLKESGIDMRQLVFSNTLEQVCIFAAVDYDLTRNVHEFTIQQGVNKTKKVRSLLGISGGVRKKKHNHRRVNAPRNKKGFWAMREYIQERFGKFTWPKATLENQCVAHGGMRIVEFNQTQDFARLYFQPRSSYKGMMLWHSTGTGKCHARDTPILMYDGSIKMVQDIVEGDVLMGDDSTPRRVLSVARGRDQLYEVRPRTPTAGSPYIVNSEHILCLKSGCSNDVYEIPVKEYVTLDKSSQDTLYGYRVDGAVEFGTLTALIENPYEYGRALNGKIPLEVKTSDANTRLAVLEGILSTKCAKDPDMEFMARSLGRTLVQHEDGGVCLSDGAVHRTSLIDVVPFGDESGEYFGFTLDGNNRYLLGDFTVTHNTCSAVAIATTSWEREGYSILWVTRHTLKPDIWKNMYKDVCSLVVRDRIRRGEIPEDAIKKPMKYTSKMWMSPMSYKQFSNMLLGKNELYNDIVRRNGKTDLLKKTFIIIDEAHKLFAKDVPASERPDVATIYKAIHDSYEKSGADSARVLLMTATPYTSDPMDMIKLLNLMRPRTEALPDQFDFFASKYLDINTGDFSDNGRDAFLDDIAGYVSYLNREQDARQFSYPVYENVLVPLSQSERIAQREELDELVSSVQTHEANIKEGTEAIKAAKRRVRDDKARIKKECDERFRKAAEKKACKDEAIAEMSRFQRELLTDLENKVETDKDSLQSLKQRVRALKKHVKDVKADMSQEGALEARCKV
jgi:hypothetical protein